MKSKSWVSVLSWCALSACSRISRLAVRSWQIKHGAENVGTCQKTGIARTDTLTSSGITITDYCLRRKDNSRGTHFFQGCCVLDITGEWTMFKIHWVRLV